MYMRSCQILNATDYDELALAAIALIDANRFTFCKLRNLLYIRIQRKLSDFDVNFVESAKQIKSMVGNCILKKENLTLQ